MPTGVALDTNVLATFSKSMKASTITTSTFKLFDSALEIPGAVSYDAPSQTATFDPTESLDWNTTYTAVVYGDGGSGVLDDVTGEEALHGLEQGVELHDGVRGVPDGPQQQPDHQPVRGAPLHEYERGVLEGHGRDDDNRHDLHPLRRRRLYHRYGRVRSGHPHRHLRSRYRPRLGQDVHRHHHHGRRRHRWTAPAERPSLDVHHGHAGAPDRGQPHPRAGSHRGGRRLEPDAATFSKDIDPASIVDDTTCIVFEDLNGNYLYDDEPTDTLVSSDATWTAARVVTIDPAADLAWNTTYTVNITDRRVKDTDGLFMRNVSFWFFTTKVAVHPTVSNTVPAPDATPACCCPIPSPRPSRRT